MTANGPRQPALLELHARLGATFAESNGWTLPAHYGDPAVEARAARTAAVVLDASERSRLLLTGTDGGDVLRAVGGEAVGDLEEGRTTAVSVLDAAGTLRDIALVSRTGGIAWMVSGEPGQRFETLTHLRAATPPGFDLRLEDRTETTCAVVIAGPGAANIVAEQVAEALPDRLPHLHCLAFAFHGFRALAVRSGAFGEDGFTILTSPAAAAHLFEIVVAGGVQPVGTAAREILRVEACLPAFDPDLVTGLSPAEAGLDVRPDVLPGAGGRVLCALLFEGAYVAPRGAQCRAHDAVVGEVRSCLRSPSLDATIGLAILESRYAFPGTPLSVDGHPVHVVAKPFVRRRSP